MNRGEWETLDPGGYVCKIVKAEDSVSKSGKEMLILYFDIAEGQSSGFYKRQYEQSKQYRSEPKWQGVYYQISEGDQTKYFKGLITTLEESNHFRFDFNEKNLVGKIFGGIFGREEYKNAKGECKFNTKLSFVRSADEVRKGNFEIPKDKLLSGQQTMIAKATDNAIMDNDFHLMGDDDSLPF